MNRVNVYAVLALFALIPSVAVSAISDVVPNVLTPNDKVEDGDAVRVVGKMIARDEKDRDGNVVTRAFLERDDGADDDRVE